MKKTSVLLFLGCVACFSHVPPAPPVDAVRTAIDIKYVGVPAMNIYSEPSELAPVITTYGYTETISVLDRAGEWVEVRTIDGSGWARASDLITAAEVDAILKDPTPRFAIAPVAIPSGARGEIAINADVNPNGEVGIVTVVKNTTGVPSLATANAAALQQARFFPIIQRGQRMMFTYHYEVTY